MGKVIRNGGVDFQANSLFGQHSEFSSELMPHTNGRRSVMVKNYNRYCALCRHNDYQSHVANRAPFIRPAATSRCYRGDWRTSPIESCTDGVLIEADCELPRVVYKDSGQRIGGTHFINIAMRWGVYSRVDCANLSVDRRPNYHDGNSKLRQ